jgi:hypothetical protein
MSLRTALAGATTTAVVVAALGNPAAVDAARDSDQQALAATLTGFANWDVGDAPGDVVGLVALRLGLVVVIAGLLCALVGRSRSRAAAFLGGWGATTVAAGIAGAAAFVYQVPVVFDGNAGAPTYGDGLVQAVNAGAAFGLWTGWLVGLVLALVTRPAAAVVVSPAYGRAPTTDPVQPVAPHIAEPPPPWWAPTHAADAGVRPGPTAFPPGGLAGPVVAGVGEPVAPFPAPPPGPSHDMTTVSGDPHPSDPDATRPVGLPPETASDEPAAPPPEPPDPDATTTMEPESGASDHTAEMPRRPDS